MGASASVIQEYYKAVDYWAAIVGNRDWKLSVWIVGQNDVDLVDRFLEIERSPVGQFDDIFFRFDTPYRGDDEEYTEQLWQEYAGWFSEKVEEKYDILRALRHDGLLKEEYIPDETKVYKMLFVGKGRNGANSNDTGIAYLLDFDGNHGIFRETAQCRCKHGWISNA